MLDWLRTFFSSEGFMPHGHCYLWRPEILWTHAISDFLIGLAYTTIPLALWVLLRRRRDVPFNSIVALFGIFIVSCGMTHFMEVVTAWHPAYRLAGGIKVVTAAASVLTAVQLVRFLPAAIALPNITQYQGMYELAKESQEAYRAILEASQDGFYVLEPVRDADGDARDFRIVDLNSAAAGQMGLPREALAGRRVGELDDGGLLRGLVDALAEVTRTGRPLQREHGAGDPRRHYVAGVAPLRGGVGLTLRDVTEQRAAVERIRESERRYRLIVGQAPITFFALDRNGTYLLADGKAYARLHLDPATLRGRSILDVFADVPRAQELVRRALAGEEASGVIDLGELVMKSQLSPVRGEDGALEGATGVSVDVTDQVRAERELKALTESLERRVHDRTAALEIANEELQSFAYTVAHDLRSPLRAMDGFADAIERDASNQLSERSRAYLARVRAASKRMSHLIDDLLNLSRVTRVELLRREVDLSALAQGVLAELAARDPGRDVRVDVEPGLVVEGDPYLLRVAVENLLANAWKFTAPVPEARIAFGSTERDGRRAYVVRDNGVGFDMAYVGQLFTPFQRLHGRDEFEGTGIGLATVKRILARHGGEVWAEAEPGKGAAFTFTLPPAPRDA